MLIKDYFSLVLTAFMVGIICTATQSSSFAIGDPIISVSNANNIVPVQGENPPGLNNDSTQEQGSQLGFPGTFTSPIPYSGGIWNKITDVCSGGLGGDADGDAICDNWENPNTLGNSVGHLFIKCPTAGMDPLCDPNAKYNLCINDEFASVWGTKPDGTPQIPQIICPKLGHKDVFVEIDFMTGHDPDNTAIKNVIKAFGNSPVSNTASDDFGRLTGITLHIVEDETLTRVTPIWAWQDTGGIDDSNYNNDFKSIKERHFGLNINPLRMPDNPVDERAPCPSGAPCLPATITGKKELLLKHYVYHYNTFVVNWQGDPPTNCGPSGTAETLGNDFIVSLGCGFWGSDGGIPPGSIGNISQQAGTFMHELGHNLNLAHGGPLGVASFPTSQANINCKPNELSVMSWSRQVPSIVSETNWVNYKFLDYSRGAVLTGANVDLKEGTPNTPGLVESDGLKLPAGLATNLAVYGTPGLVQAARTAIITTAISPIDWSGTPPPPPTPPAGTVFQDVNNLALSPQCVMSVGPSPDGQVFKSMNEWNNLKFYFLNDGDSQDGVPDGEQFDELTGEMVQNLTNLRNQFSGLLDPINSNGSSVFNRGDIIPVKLQLRDIDGNFMANENITFSAERINGSLPNTNLSSSYPPSQFGYSNSTNTYLFDWPTVELQEGIWGIHAILNINSTNKQSLLQGEPPIPSGMSGMLTIKP